MKLVGVFNPCGYNPIKNPTARETYFCTLEVVYQDEDGKYYVKYLDQGDLPLLLSTLERIHNTKEREEELSRYLNGEINKNTNIRYKPIKNQFFYANINLDEKSQLIKCYSSFHDFPGDIILEKDDENELDHYNRAVAVFPKKELIVGSHDFVYQSASPSIKLEGKSVDEIKGLISWLVQNMYLEEAYTLINQVKSSEVDLEEYRHPENLFVTDGTTNFLDSRLRQIEDLCFVRDHTKQLKLKIFTK